MVERIARIPEYHIRTPQEEYFCGGTPDTNRIKVKEDWHRPIGLLTNSFSFENVNGERQDLKTFLSNIAGVILSINARGVFQFEELDPATLKTTKDPTLLRLVDAKGNVLLDDDELLNQEFYQLLWESKYSIPFPMHEVDNTSDL